MKRNLLLAGVVALASTPAIAAGNAANGLQAMRELNLIVLGDVSGGDDVEGKTFVGGNFSGNSTPLGIGNGSQGLTPSARRTLTVGGNVTANININNGSNGGAGQVATVPGVLVGGNLGSSNFNASGSAVDVGGNFGGNLNLSNGQTVNVGGSVTGSVNGSNNTQTVNAGGSINGNANGAGFNPNLGIGWNAASTFQAVAAEKATLEADLKALSSALGGLSIVSNPSTINAGGQGPTFNAVDNGAGYALFNIAGSLLASNEIDFTGGSTMPIIVNVSGASITWTANPVGGYSGLRNQQIIWNFTEATNIAFQKLVHGSVLAPFATISNTTPIEGSVVAANFNQGGEVHLGTYKLGGDFLNTPGGSVVPEPATWAMMIMGFGLVGAAMRRRALAVN